MDPTMQTGDERHELRRRADELNRLGELSERLGTSLSDAFTKGASAGGRFDRTLQTLSRSLLNLGLNLAKAPLQNLIQQGVGSLMKGLGGAGGATPFAQGGVFSQGRVTPFAQGGVVAAPTYFPMRGGAGLMGERGPEAIMPLARGPDGKLGVAGGGVSRPIAITVNIAATDVQSFRRSEAQVSASLARAVARGGRAM
jgi:phage-related minor tail protein